MVGVTPQPEKGTRGNGQFGALLAELGVFSLNHLKTASQSSLPRTPHSPSSLDEGIHMDSKIA